MGGKHEVDSNQEDEGPPQKRRSSPKPEEASRTVDTIDYFREHFCQNIPGRVLEQLKDGDSKPMMKVRLEAFNKHHAAQFFDNGSELNWDRRGSPALTYAEACIHKRLLKKSDGPEENKTGAELFGIIGRYLSLCCVAKPVDYMRTYCLHVLNHILRTRTIIIDNQKRLDSVGRNLSDDLIEETRDQGFNRPKVLILAPFKKSAYQIVHTMADLLLPGERNYVLNWKKFEEEYGDNGASIGETWKSSAEFKELMSGNIDDSFRIGLSLGKKAIKLYTAFNNSDMIISSPLGLRMIVGDKEQEAAKRECDFLSSIEVLILEDTHVLLMQNWEHLLTIMETVNVVPNNIEADISRVRRWSLDGYGEFYRQTIAFSDINSTELRVLFAKYDKNFAGLLTLTKIPSSLLPEIEIPIVQELHRFSCEDAQKQSDLRFEYFVHDILPKLEIGTLIFIPSYFDYVRLRNYLRNDNESFAQVHEYASDSKIKKSRKAFATHEKKLLLLTERVHFFRSFLVKGVKSIVFYQAPTNPAFYVQIINMAIGESTKVHSRLLYSSVDVIRLQNVFGPRQAKELLQSEKSFHLIVSE